MFVIAELCIKTGLCTSNGLDNLKAFIYSFVGVQGKICQKARKKPIPGGWARIRGDVPDVSI